MGEANTSRPGAVLDHTNSTGNTESGGKIVQEAGLAAILVSDVLDTFTVAASIEGIHSIQKKALAFLDGEEIHWDEDGDPLNGTSGSGAATNVAADGDFVLGTQVGDAGSGVERGDVHLNHFAKTNIVADGIADPGDGNAISVAQTGNVSMVSSGSETRTLAIPGFVGQEILLNHQTDGGAIVVTVASAINQTGNNTLTFTEVNDAIMLIAIDDAGTLAWRIIFNDGVALTTV